MKKIVLGIVGLLCCGFLQAQPLTEGTVKVIADPRIDSLMELHIAYNAAFPTVDGYRIHIYMGSGNEALERAEEIKTEFEEKYEDTPAYITFGEPYYRVRVGDFRTRLDASRFLQRIERKYPNAWVIREKINLPVIPKYQKTNQYE